MSKNEFVVDLDGVNVKKVGKNFEVSFEYSDTLVRRMGMLKDGTEDGVNFDRDKNVWQVPGKLSDPLGPVVESMREFVRGNGVQVSVASNGMHYLECDYDKRMAEKAGAIMGAEFNKEIMAWQIPANSPALVAKDGARSFLDKTVEDMRAIRVETSNNLEAIRAKALSFAQNEKMKPGLMFGHANESRIGLVIDANSSFALQETGRKNDVIYLAIHNQNALDKEAKKGDDLYISYDKAGRHASVRSKEVFKEQQQEREELRNFASGKITDAKVMNARLEDSNYKGEIIKVLKHFSLQSVGRGEFLVHNKDRLSHDIREGANVAIKYHNGRGKVTDMEQKKVVGVDR